MCDLRRLVFESYVRLSCSADCPLPVVLLRFFRPPSHSSPFSYSLLSAPLSLSRAELAPLFLDFYEQHPPHSWQSEPTQPFLSL